MIYKNGEWYCRVCGKHIVPRKFTPSFLRVENDGLCDDCRKGLEKERRECSND